VLTMYERIERLCKAKGLNVTQMCSEAGIPRANLSDYKTGRKKSLGIPTLTKIAAYFDVSVGYLLGTEKTPAEAEGDNELIEILEEFRYNPELRTLFSLSKGATPEELRKYADVIRALRGTYRE